MRVSDVDATSAWRRFRKFNFEDVFKIHILQYGLGDGLRDECGLTGVLPVPLVLFCLRCEWHTYSEWLKHDLRQILVETHNAPMPNARDFFYNLHDAGYVIFSKEANFQNAGGGVEFAFLKLSTDFFVNNTMYSKLSSI